MGYEEKRGAFSILIVDNNPENILLLGNLLGERGYAVESANDGEEALKRVKTGRFDLILLAVMIPGMDGFTVCRHLKGSKTTSDIPVIFLTARTDPEDLVKGFQAGAVDYIGKPFNPPELLARVNTHLELKFARDVLKRMAMMDGLTQLYNHSFFHERLSQEISLAQRHDHPLSIVMLDLDHFKKINDTYGHKAGDTVLVHTAGSIKNVLRKEDVPGRYGGEEFIIALPNTNATSAYAVAEKIRVTIQNNRWQLGDLTVTVSGGVCALKDEDANGLITNADRLMYDAKKGGRNQIALG